MPRGYDTRHDPNRRPPRYVGFDSDHMPFDRGRPNVRRGSSVYGGGFIEDATDFEDPEDDPADRQAMRGYKYPSGS